MHRVLVHAAKGSLTVHIANPQPTAIKAMINMHQRTIGNTAAACRYSSRRHLRNRVVVRAFTDGQKAMVQNTVTAEVDALRDRMDTKLDKVSKEVQELKAGVAELKTSTKKDFELVRKDFELVRKDFELVKLSLSEESESLMKSMIISTLVIVSFVAGAPSVQSFIEKFIGT